MIHHILQTFGLSQDNKYAEGGQLGVVEVKFSDPKYNYQTNVNPKITEKEAREYFVGKRFDLGVFPKEDYQECIDIDFTPANKYADGGVLKVSKGENDKYYWKFTFENGKEEKSFDGFNSKADAQRDFQYRSKYFNMAKGGSIEDLKVGAKLGLLNPRNGRYRYSTIEKIDGEDVYLLEKHPTRSQWDNNWQTTKSNINRFLNEDNADFKDRKSYVLKYEHGGSIEDENKDMVLNNNKQIRHHTEELMKAVQNSKHIPAWVVAKIERSATDISDATHFLEGEKMAKGGGVDEYGTYKVTFQDDTDDKLTWSEYAYANSEEQAISRSAQSLNKKYPTYNFSKMKVIEVEEGEKFANGGGVEWSDMYSVEKLKHGGQLHIYKKGGNVEVHIVNEGQKFDENRYPAIFQDYDKDGIQNVDELQPRNPKIKELSDEPKLSKVFSHLLNIKNQLDDDMYSFVKHLQNISEDGNKIYARTKTPFSIINKLVDKRLMDKKKGLTDLIGTTLVVNDKKELDRVKDLIENEKLGKVVEFENFYEHPKEGYRAYHFLIEYNGHTVELQLKTKRMKELNMLSHAAYKAKELDGKVFDYYTNLVNKADNGDSNAEKEFDSFIHSADAHKIFYKK